MTPSYNNTRDKNTLANKDINVLHKMRSEIDRILKIKTKSQIQKPKHKSQSQLGYERFKHTIYSTLRKSKYGLTWGEIKEKTGLSQRVPYNGWVRNLESDIGLRRRHEMRGIVWSINKE
jgi:hypothetical protein